MITLKVIDSHNAIEDSDDDCLIVYWNGANDNKNLNANTIFMPEFIEERADSLRKRYLSFIYALGRRDIDGVHLTKYLEIREKFSFWWMSRVFEKCSWDKSPHLFDVIKLMALEEWLRGRNFDEIFVQSNNLNLIKTLKIWALKEKKIFKTDNKIKRIQVTRARNFLVKKFILWGALELPYYFFSRASLRNIGVDEVVNSDASVTFFTYLFNVPDQNDVEHKFGSQFWGSLPQILSLKNIKTNWIHLYVKDQKISSAKSAATRIIDENIKSHGITSNASIDSFLSGRVFLRAAIDWFSLLVRYKNLKNLRFYDEQSSLDFTPFFETEWRDSIIGKSSSINLINFNTIEELLNKLPKQKLGVYLQENCPWEIALNFLWKRAGHGKLIGSPHTTILFWDLRYFHDIRLLKEGDEQEIPMPLCTAVNGPVAMRMMLNGGYSRSQLTEVEALRYLYLGVEKNVHFVSPSKGMYLLVLCDFSISRTANQLDILFEAIKYLNFSINVIIKPHPNCPVEIQGNARKYCEIKYDPISQLLKKCNLVYSSDATSASVEAYCKGLPTISVINPSGFNLSPLRDYPDVVFVRSAFELMEALKNKNDEIGIIKRIEKNEYFNLDHNLSSWISLIG